MTAWTEEFDRRIREAQSLRYETDAAPLLEEAVRLADRNNDEPRAILARYLFVFSVAPIDPQRALVEFAWCASHRDIESPYLPHYAIPQLYGIAVGILRSYPDYSLAQIDRTLEEMERAFDEAGLDRRDVYHHRIYASLGTGRRDEAVEWFKKWSHTPPQQSTCPACERGTRVLFYLHGEDYDRAVSEAKPILEGHLSCEDGQPLTTYSASLIPLIRLGRADEALIYYQAARQLLDGMGYASLWSAGRHLTFASLTHRTVDAIDIFETWAPRAFEYGTATDRFGLMLASGVLARHLQHLGDRSSLSLPDVEGIPPVSPDNTFDVNGFRAWVGSVSTDLAIRFDHRNGNGEYSRIAGLFDTLWDESNHRL